MAQKKCSVCFASRRDGATILSLSGQKVCRECFEDGSGPISPSEARDGAGEDTKTAGEMTVDDLVGRRAARLDVDLRDLPLEVADRVRVRNGVFRRAAPGTDSRGSTNSEPSDGDGRNDSSREEVVPYSSRDHDSSQGSPDDPEDPPIISGGPVPSLEEVPDRILKDLVDDCTHKTLCANCEESFIYQRNVRTAYCPECETKYVVAGTV